MKDNMGMDYVPVYEDDTATTGTATSIQVPQDKQQLIGVRKGKVVRRELTRDIRATARVVLDQELYDAQKAYLGTDVFKSAYWNTETQKLRMLGMSESEIADLKKKTLARWWPVVVCPVQ